MNELSSDLNKRDLEDKMIKKTFLPISTRRTFLFGNSIIETPWLSVYYLDQFYVR